MNNLRDSCSVNDQRLTLAHFQKFTLQGFYFLWEYKKKLGFLNYTKFYKYVSIYLLHLKEFVIEGERWVNGHKSSLKETWFRINRDLKSLFCPLEGKSWDGGSGNWGAILGMGWRVIIGGAVGLHSCVIQRSLSSLSWYNQMGHLLLVFTDLGQDRYIAAGFRED